MSRRTVSLLVVVSLLIMAYIFFRVRYQGKAPVKLGAEQCDAELWKHVYDKDRLQVLEACTAVEGRVAAVDRAEDGDLHISLDPDQKSVLNLVNVAHAKRTLVVEAVCDHVAGDAEERAACELFQSRVPAPAVGDRVRVIGAYVRDRDNGWNEVHPVSRIEKLR